MLPARVLDGKDVVIGSLTKGNPALLISFPSRSGLASDAMPRRARRVPPDWKHPTDVGGTSIPLYDGTRYQARVEAWQQHAARWLKGFDWNGDSQTWEPISDELRGLTFIEAQGPPPDPVEYTPQWSAAEATHWQYYEEVSKGTPLSPVFNSPEALARWIADHIPGSTWTGQVLRAFDLRRDLV